MEQDVGIPTTLFGGPPELGNIVKLGQSQNSFMNFFARPLFEAVTDILPAMVFAVDELKINQATWTERIRLENEESSQSSRKRDVSAGGLSPRSMSPNRLGSQPQLSHPEGLPASISSSEPLLNMTQSQPNLPSQSGRPPDDPAHHALGSVDFNNPSDFRRRSSNEKYLNQSLSNPETATDFSRRSSGALSAAGIPNGVVVQRRTSNTSPSQLQLGSDSRSHVNASVAASENRFGNGRVSEDTLSQMPYVNGAMTLSDARRGSANSGGAGDATRRSSKGPELHFSNNQSISSSTSNRPYVPYDHHRSSSGAHTNNTTLSQSTPYSPTGTQATSVLTVDSDEKIPQSRLDIWTERNGLPDAPDMERPGNNYRLGNSTSIGHGLLHHDVKTSVFGNGGLRHSSGLGIRKKNSRFNIFHSWKRRGNRLEAGP